jgi:hypothetical protein
MTTPARILIKIFLMIFLSSIEVFNRLYLNGKLLSLFLLLPLIFCLNLRQLILHRIVDPRTILYADIISLPVHGYRINYHEIVFQQLCKTDPALIIINPNCLCMAAVITDLLIGRTLAADQRERVLPYRIPLPAEVNPEAQRIRLWYTFSS